MKLKYSSILILLLALAMVLLPTGNAFANSVPVTGPKSDNLTPASISAAAIAPFVALVATSGNPNQAAGIYAGGFFAAPIIQQPSSAPGFVSTQEGAATQFGMAAQYGTIALLAHNYLLGEQFLDIEVGKVLTLVYGDGHSQAYRVEEVFSIRRLPPTALILISLT